MGELNHKILLNMIKFKLLSLITHLFFLSKKNSLTNDVQVNGFLIFQVYGFDVLSYKLVSFKNVFL